MNKYQYPLQVDPFTIVDRVKIAKFILNKKNRLSIGPKVAEFEKVFSEKYAEGHPTLLTSSGSTANHLLVEIHRNLYPTDKTVVLAPSTTWSSSLTPWTMAGFQLHNVDINKENLGIDLQKAEKLADQMLEDKKIPIRIVFWITALVGMMPNVNEIKRLQEKYKDKPVNFYLDACECTFGKFDGENILGSKLFEMTTTSFFFAHYINGIELGALVINGVNKIADVGVQHIIRLWELGKMIRSHGLTRNLDNHSSLRSIYEKQNPDIHPQFLFGVQGTNYRPTEINAYFAFLDLRRAEKYIYKRAELLDYYLNRFEANGLKKQYWNPADFGSINAVPFCIPIFVRAASKRNQLVKLLEENRWETRPVISGNILRSPAFAKLTGTKVEEAYKKLFKNSDFVHFHGLYVGLHGFMKLSDIDKLIEVLKKLK